jgi:hypothetical protein
LFEIALCYSNCVTFFFTRNKEILDALSASRFVSFMYFLFCLAEGELFNYTPKLREVVYYKYGKG